MKVLTLHQPWASLVALGVKTIETRSWSTQYRGQLAIHAAATMPSYDRRYVSGVSVRHEAGFVGGGWRVYLFNAAMTQHSKAPEPKLHSEFGEVDWPCPLGAIVATCTLVDVVPIIDPDRCEWHIEHPRGVEACAHSAIDGQVITHTPEGNYHTTVVVEQAYGDFTPGRFAWLLADVVPVDPPVPFKGGQGLTRTWEP